MVAPKTLYFDKAELVHSELAKHLAPARRTMRKSTMRKKYYVIGEREGERERTLAKRENSQPSRSAKNAHPFCMVDFVRVCLSPRSASALRSQPPPILFLRTTVHLASHQEQRRRSSTEDRRRPTRTVRHRHTSSASTPDCDCVCRVIELAHALFLYLLLRSCCC